MLLSVVFSCTDHVIPEPEKNCKLENGSDRPFQCEFELVKLDFLSQNTENILQTVTKNSSNVNLSVRTDYTLTFGSLGVGEVASTLIPSYRVRLTIKRIATAPTPTDTYGYIFMDDSGKDQFTRTVPVPLDLQLGETTTLILLASYNTVEKLFTPIQDVYTYRLPNNPEGIAIFNLSTYDRLNKAPYNYVKIRDKAEAFLTFKTEMRD